MVKPMIETITSSQALREAIEQEAAHSPSMVP